MSLALAALLALLALAQINLLSPVNTPFPGRIWASDTFIFSAIWENTRGGFGHSVRRQAWAFMFWFSLRVTCEPVSSSWLNLHNAEARLQIMHFTWHGVWPGLMTPLGSSILLLTQCCHKGCHPFLRMITLVFHPGKGWPCFIAFTHFRQCVSWPVSMMNKRDFPLGTPLTDFQFTQARDKMPYVSRGPGKIFMSALFWMDYMA